MVFKKVAGLQGCSLTRKKLTQCFPVKFAKSLKTPIFTEHVRGGMCPAVAFTVILVVT